jgi:hypothetical protein
MRCSHLADLTRLGGIILTRYSTCFIRTWRGAAGIGYMGRLSPPTGGFQAHGYPATSAWASWLEGWGEQHWPACAAASCRPWPGRHHHRRQSSSRPAGPSTPPSIALCKCRQEALGASGLDFVMNSSDGEILAISRRILIQTCSIHQPYSADLQAVLQDPGKPLVNRATQGIHPLARCSR